jgi:hypothetical protein
MLEQFLIPQTKTTKRDALTSSKEGAPPHYLGEVLEYLNTRSPSRWIGREGHRVPRILHPRIFYGDSFTITM